MSTTKNKLPVTLILRRKSIRIYPNNIVVGLYYSDALKKHVTIPYEDIGISEEIQNDMLNLAEELND